MTVKTAVTARLNPPTQDASSNAATQDPSHHRWNFDSMVYRASMV
jgi:hypothetical protein